MLRDVVVVLVLVGGADRVVGATVCVQNVGPVFECLELAVGSGEDAVDAGAAAYVVGLVGCMAGVAEDNYCVD